MVLNFIGTAHPPPGRQPAHDADLSRAEIASTNLGRRGGTEVLVEHDASAGVVGRVTSSWEGRDGSLRVSGVIHDDGAAQAVRKGSMRGLSLGTAVTSDAETGKPLLRTHEELSVCAAPRRAGCFIDEVDGRRVRRQDRFSKGARYLHKPSLPALLACKDD